MRRLDRYLIGSFLRLFVRTVALSVFILMMQMVWKYIEELTGRGIELSVLLQLLVYWSAAVLPMAVPVAVLLAGIMVYGDLAESNEFAALRASGIGFWRMSRPLLVVVGLVGVGMFFVNNNVIPVANFKGENLLINIAQQKPTFNLQPGYFYHGLEGYTVKVDRKSDQDVWGIMVYDHTDRTQGNARLLSAPHGTLRPIAGGKWLELTLENGAIYEELKARTPEERTGRPFLRAEFDTLFMRFNMANFQGKDLYAVQRTNQFNMLTVRQLESSLDSLERVLGQRKVEMGREWTLRYSGLDSARTWVPRATLSWSFDQLDAADQARIVGNARFMAEAQKERMAQSRMEMDYRSEVAVRHELEWHKKFAISVACVLLFFIGAPLGAVIRKGGFGLPFVLSVLLFLLHYVLGMVSEKMGRGSVLTPAEAIWLPNLVLLPLAVWMVHLAASDRTWNFQKRGSTSPVQ